MVADDVSFCVPSIKSEVSDRTSAQAELLMSCPSQQFVEFESWDG